MLEQAALGLSRTPLLVEAVVVAGATRRALNAGRDFLSIPHPNARHVNTFINRVREHTTDIGRHPIEALHYHQTPIPKSRSKYGTYAAGWGFSPDDISQNESRYKLRGGTLGPEMARALQFVRGISAVAGGRHRGGEDYGITEFRFRDPAHSRLVFDKIVNTFGGDLSEYENALEYQKIGRGDEAYHDVTLYHGKLLPIVARQFRNRAANPAKP